MEGIGGGRGNGAEDAPAGGARVGLLFVPPPLRFGLHVLHVAACADMFLCFTVMYLRTCPNSQEPLPNRPPIVQGFWVVCRAACAI